MASKNVFTFGMLLMLFGIFPMVVNAAGTKGQSAIQTGTTVRARVNATGIYDQKCYDTYYGCMDQFCIMENGNGGSCTCSDLNAGLENQLAAIQDILTEAERIRSEEVERVKAGAQADIIFNGSRQYDSDGNVIYSRSVEQQTKEQKRANRLALWDNPLNDSEEDFENSGESIADKTGNDLFMAANELCQSQMQSSCAKDMNILQQLYSRQITSDCKAFENSIIQSLAKANAELASANAEVRNALKESFAESNKYDLGQCMVEFKKCMQTEDACGNGWDNCVSIIASENMQNNAAVSTAKTKVNKVDVFDIAASTMDLLNTKRNICEHVLNQCVAVRDQVWPAFLKEASPYIKLAEAQAESKYRGSCLTTISDCIHKACKDDIAGKGVATMDACLSRPDMARSFCKVEIDPCERMDSSIWEYVSDKLAAMRVDACTQEVKDCITDETRCGADFSNCIGMDYEYIRKICPVDKLVVCKANKPNFSIADLDSMLIGLYANIDNAALTTCQNLVDKKMLEVCGSTTDCNKFASSDNLGTGSLRSVKDGNIYRITGMISLGAVKTGDVSGSVTDGDEILGVGKIGIQDYIAKLHENNASVDNADEIIATIEEELNNISRTINRTIDLIEQDQEIQYCVSGRDLSRITGESGKTKARFPHLLDQLKMQIAQSALNKARVNYEEKYNSLVADATQNASLDVAQYMCQMLPLRKGAQYDETTETNAKLASEYEISYEINTGISTGKLAQGGHDSTDGTVKVENDGWFAKKTVQELPTGTREMWSSFNRDTRVCHLCSVTTIKNCNSVYKKGFLGIGAKNEVNCTESEPVEECEDLKM